MSQDRPVRTAPSYEDHAVELIAPYVGGHVAARTIVGEMLYLVRMLLESRLAADLPRRDEPLPAVIRSPKTIAWLVEVAEDWRRIGRRVDTCEHVRAQRHKLDPAYPPPFLSVCLECGGVCSHVEPTPQPTDLWLRPQCVAELLGVARSIDQEVLPPEKANKTLDEKTKRAAASLVDGFYWIDWPDGPIVAQRTSDHGRIHWNTPGSEDFYTGDDAVDVVAGPLAPPVDG